MYQFFVQNAESASMPVRSRQYIMELRVCLPAGWLNFREISSFLSHFFLWQFLLPDQ